LPRLSNSFYTQIGKWWGGVQEAMEGAWEKEVSGEFKN
jgi:hypothetical protein